MRSKNSYRPQNQHPDGLVQSRKQVAEQHYQQVRVTVQAMLRRGMKPQEITVPVVAKEAGVSVATIYRRADLFTIVQRGNPAIQREPHSHQAKARENAGGVHFRAQSHHTGTLRAR
ncbi:hypothetical protein [Ktedonobacter racemifer]|uniref:Uncharacterized protein n=1 Tax=Ktedonobacter racemifer DSM 44963 TaxID=485913 RepID=D6TVK6_KTERA|nr:hypothetical protein [Ktedonobacter racemifer]EFH85409.1 hypothetical protein Krac_6629 [Ktedonobacter racemifer DSM 44963]